MANGNNNGEMKTINEVEQVDVPQLSLQIEQQRERIKLAQEKIKELEPSLDRIKDQRKAKQGNYDEQKTKAKELEKRRNSFNLQRDNLEGINYSKEAKEGEVRPSITERNAQLKSLNNIISKLNEEIDSANKRAGESSKEVNDLKEREEKVRGLMSHQTIQTVKSEGAIIRLEKDIEDKTVTRRQKLLKQAIIVPKITAEEKERRQLIIRKEGGEELPTEEKERLEELTTKEEAKVTRLAETGEKVTERKREKAEEALKREKLIKGIPQRTKDIAKAKARKEFRLGTHKERLRKGRIRGEQFAQSVAVSQAREERKPKVSLDDTNLRTQDDRLA